MRVAQKWLKNNLRVSWAEGKMSSMEMHHSITYTGAMNLLLGTRLSEGEWDEIQLKRGKARSQRAWSHEKDFNFIFEATGDKRIFK